MTDLKKSDIIKTDKREGDRNSQKYTKTFQKGLRPTHRKRSIMTRREFFEAVMAHEGIEVELHDFAANEIEKLNARNAKRSSTPSKRALANEPIKAEIVKVLTHDAQSASEIAEKVGISTQKSSSLLRQIDGLTVSELKVKGRKVKGYALA